MKREDDPNVVTDTVTIGPWDTGLGGRDDSVTSEDKVTFLVSVCQYATTKGLQGVLIIEIWGLHSRPQGKTAIS